MGGFADHCNQTFDRIFAIADLRAEAPGRDDDHAVSRCPATGDLQQPHAHPFWQRRGTRCIKSQLRCSCYLVDVLPAGPGRQDIADLKLSFGKGQAGENGNCHDTPHSISHHEMPVSLLLTPGQ